MASGQEGERRRRGGQGLSPTGQHGACLLDPSMRRPFPQPLWNMQKLGAGGKPGKDGTPHPSPQASQEDEGQIPRSLSMGHGTYQVSLLDPKWVPWPWRCPFSPLGLSLLL